MCVKQNGEWLKDIEDISWEGEEIGFCDTCDEPHENGSSLDHCRECGNCWEHCECSPKRTVESNEEEDVLAGLIAPLDIADDIWERGKYSGRDMFDRMEQHLGHDIEVARYGTPDLTYNMAIECLDCGEVIFDIDNGYIDEGPADGMDYEPDVEEDPGIGTVFVSDYDGVNPNGISVVGYPVR